MKEPIESGATEQNDRDDGGLDRRDLLRLAAAGTAGAIAAAAIPSVALANTGDTVVVGTPAVASTSVVALRGEASQADGVNGISTAQDLTGVYGENWVGNGVKGSGATGVWGYSPNGDGVNGDAGTAGKSGVFAHNDVAGGYGVFARSDNGIAVRVEGLASMKRSGVASVAKKKSYVTITVPGVPLTADSKFLVTMQKSAGAGVYVQYAIKSSATTFRAYFNKKTIKSTKVAWMVLD